MKKPKVQPYPPRFDRNAEPGECVNLRFVPLQAIGLVNYNPGEGGRDTERMPSFEYDPATRRVKYEHGDVGRLPDGWDAYHANTDEPLNFFTWFVGTVEDIAELRKATEAYRRARDRLVQLIGNGDE